MATLPVSKTFAVTSAALLVAHLIPLAFLPRMPLAATSITKYGGINPVAPDANDATKGRLLETMGKLPMHFEENQPSQRTSSKFIGRADGIDFGITPTEVVTRLHTAEARVETLPRPTAWPARIEGVSGENSESSSEKPRPKTALLRMQLVGANRRARVIGESQLATRSNYFIGNDPNRWRTNVANYERVRVEQVYPGVDVVHYGSGQQLEYDFEVAPGAGFKAIRLRFIGARSLRINGTGELEIETPAGILRHRKPVAYQQFKGARREIGARYVVNPNREVRFQLTSYHRRLPLTLDPVLSYATYIGSRSGGDLVRAVTFDAAGAAYVVGTTASSDLPTTPGALQPANRFGDVFISKLNPSGSAVLYATYLGGSGSDNGSGIAVDATGSAYVTGTTYSPDFPTTPNAFQPQSPGITTHAFVAKLNPAGTALIYATYIGGPNELADVAGIALDAAGQATIAGRTDSSSFPTTAGALQPKLGGASDAFVVRLNADGSALVYATYLGGESYDSATCIAVDSEGNTFVAGETLFPPTFPTTRHAYQRQMQGIRARFVSKISAAGNRLVYSTFLGGGDIQLVSGIAVDSAGNAYLTGVARTPFLPTTPGALQPVSADASDAFVTKLNDTGSDLIYSTFLGGSGMDSGNAIAVDSLGQAYVAGSTGSVDFPLVKPLQSHKLGGPLFKTTDSGANWDDVPIALDIGSLVVDPQVTSTLYASNLFDKIFKSTDSGVTWQVIATGVPGPLVIDPVRSAILYTLAERSINKSTDGGAHWQRIDIPISFFNGLSTMVIDPKTADTLYLGAHQFVAPAGFDVQAFETAPGVMFKSTDGGLSWTTVDFGRPVSGVSYLAIDPQVTSTIYAGTESVGLRKSTDGGASWFRPIASDTFFVSRLVVDPTNSATLYAIGADGILKSTNAGASWDETLKRVALTSLVIDAQAPSTLYAGNFEGLYQTTNGGTSWIVRLDQIGIRAIALDPRNPSTIYVPSVPSSDVFVSKLNATGTALVYSTYLGGTVGDSGASIASDAYGNVYVAGITSSANFPITPGAYQSRGAKRYTGFVMRLSDPVPPRVTGVTIEGKKLVVAGEGFDRGAVIVVNNADFETQNDSATPSILLISKRGGKRIGTWSNCYRPRAQLGWLSVRTVQLHAIVLIETLTIAANERGNDRWQLYRFPRHLR